MDLDNIKYNLQVIRERLGCIGIVLCFIGFLLIVISIQLYFK